MNKCIRCGSFAINHDYHGRNGSDPELCDVCYWRKRAEQLQEVVDEIPGEFDWKGEWRYKCSECGGKLIDE